MKKKSFEGPLLIFPALILIAMVLIIPIAYGFYCSLFDLKYMMAGNFMGLKNYISILKNPDTIQSLKVTFLISFSAAAISLVVGTLLALWVEKHSDFFGYCIQLVGLVPWVTSMVVAALLWKWVFDGEMGLVNYILTQLNIPMINFFAVKYAVPTTIFVIAWRTIGYSMVMILSGLKGVPSDLLEAGMVDGASPFQVFWRIKLPMIKTPALISSIVLFLSNFNNNTIPMVLTGGGPANATKVISLEAYNIAFSEYLFGRASAMSCIILAINIVLLILYVKAVKYEI